MVGAKKIEPLTPTMSRRAGDCARALICREK